MPEQEPLYFKEFRKYIDLKIESSFDNFAIIMKRQFDFIDTKFDRIEAAMATKEDVKKITDRLDRGERRFNRLHEMVLNNHGPRIHALEKEAQ